jgi:hypothetical protein
LYEKKINKIAQFLRKCHRWEDWWNLFRIFCTHAEIGLIKSAPKNLKFLLWVEIIILKMWKKFQLIWRCEEEDMRVWSDAKIPTVQLKKITKNCTLHEISIKKYSRIQLLKRTRVSLLLTLQFTVQQLEIPYFLVREATWWPRGPLGVKHLSALLVKEQMCCVQSAGTPDWGDNGCWSSVCENTLRECLVQPYKPSNI